MGTVKEPATFGYMADGNHTLNGWNWRYVDPTDTGITSARIDWSHTNRVNMLYGDGHATAVRVFGIYGKVRSNPLSLNTFD
jgi:prepilin-type processing-associated H-X9-DG protein